MSCENIELIKIGKIKEIILPEEGEPQRITLGPRILGTEFFENKSCFLKECGLNGERVFVLAEKKETLL